MRVLVAVGSDEQSLGGCTLLGRLAFKEVSGAAVYVVERLGVAVDIENVAAAPDVITRYMQLQEEGGRERLRAAGDKLASHGLKLSSELKSGFIANELMKTADTSKTDLIVLGSRDESPLTKLMIGSVTRKLVVKARQSLLVTRNVQAEHGPVRAVFATDHSPYADRCFEILLADWPSGVKDVTIVTAYPRDTVAIIGTTVGQMNVDLHAMIERELRERNARLQKRLETLGVQVRTEVSPLPVQEAIAEALQKNAAELLILGAQGHGFFERLGVGSVSFEQVVAGKVSVLVLRAPVE